MNARRSCILAALLIAAGCGGQSPVDRVEQTGTASEALSGNSPSPTPFVTRRHLDPNVETQLSVKTTPYASCVVHAVDQATSPETLPVLTADASGMLSLSVHASAAPAMIARFSLDCAGEDGSQASYPVELGGDAADDTPNPVRARVGTVIPALTDLTLSNQELLDRGYPPRPTDPKNYNAWLRAVSAPTERVPPHHIPHAQVSQFGTGTGSFNNWAGAYVTDPGGAPPARPAPGAKFWSVSAQWSVPSLLVSVPFSVPNANYGYSAAAVWVGLDNGGNDLWQSGSDSESFSFNFFGTTYSWQDQYAWIQALPSGSYVLPNVSASAGNEMYVNVFAADQYGNTAFSGNGLASSNTTMWYMVYNFTQGQSTWDTYTINSNGSTFTGSSADFIIERPSYNNNLSDLGLFGVASMEDCWFSDSLYQYDGWNLTYGGSAGVWIGQLTILNMVNGSDTLAQTLIFPVSNATYESEVLWIWSDWQ